MELTPEDVRAMGAQEHDDCPQGLEGAAYLIGGLLLSGYVLIGCYFAWGDQIGAACVRWAGECLKWARGLV